MVSVFGLGRNDFFCVWSLFRPPKKIVSVDLVRGNVGYTHIATVGPPFFANASNGLLDYPSSTLCTETCPRNSTTPYTLHTVVGCIHLLLLHWW